MKLECFGLYESKASQNIRYHLEQPNQRLTLVLVSCPKGS
jgi:hypothetical protein